ncbi:MAG TPA: heavy-metal-associated domain-containing protein [Candidatus Nanoarchaeia archaeon]|nr:heavy-metal-associated domain-containing protein [Candidatus Nanoarchaeia archaeon]
MKTTIYTPDIECESCIKLISRKLKDNPSIESFQAKQDAIEVYHNETISQDALVKLIHQAGFRASLNPFERKTFSERIKDFNTNQHKYEIEAKGIAYAAGVFFILTIFELFAYYTFFSNIPDFLSTYAMWLFYLNISISSLGLAIWHINAYKAKITCMTGMMLGMTIGMQTGMMVGAIIGATNGFFIGALTGMLLGVITGSFVGKCCGIMGIMEGMMAGLMGGTMGPMITVMMLYDNIAIFMPFYILINVIIMLGLSYMLYEEVVEYKQIQKQPSAFISFALLSILIASLLIIIMVYAPKSYAVAGLLGA